MFKGGIEDGHVSAAAMDRDGRASTSELSLHPG